MIYFSEYGIHNCYNSATHILDEFHIKLNRYDIVGFGIGANLALLYARKQIKQNNRVGKVILLSPSLAYIHWQIHMKYTHNTRILKAIKYLIKGIDNPCFKEVYKIYAQIPYSILHDLYIKTQSTPSISLESIKKSMEHHNKNPNLQDKYITKTMKCKFFTHINNPAELGEYKHYMGNYLRKIAKKSSSFMIFISENDTIGLSKQICNYFSQFAICYILKNNNQRY